MADLTGKPISELPSASSLADSDLFAISSNGASKKALWSAIKSTLGAYGGVYTDPAQIGLSGTAVTLLEIISAMPNYSLFVGSPEYNNIASWDVAGLPNNGVFLIVKNRNSRNMVIHGFMTVNNSKVNFYVSHAYASVSGSSTLDTIATWKRVWDEASACYQAGDTEATSDRISLAGFVSSSNTVMHFDYVTDKSMENISTITVTRLNGTIRGVTGYLNDTGSTNQDWTASPFTATATKLTNHHLRISINTTTAFTNSTNNTPVNALVNLTLSFA